MRGLIMDLLDLTKLEPGKKRNLKNIDISEIAKISVNTMEPLAIQKNVRLFVDVDHDIYFPADNSEMEIIFNNLVSNAVKYNKDNGEVHVSLKKNLNSIKIIIEDTGIGMSEEEISKLFHEFVRIKNVKTKNITGSGLGLSIVKKLVDVYEGKINVNSIPDKGSKFEIELPIQ